MNNKLQKKSLKQAENQNQQGRSMVEMLGVLAIIGVLSIGAIRGYRWAMDKHIANQILYEMNLNSAQLAMLLQRGNSDGVTLSLGSPYDDEVGKFKGVDYGFDYGCGESPDDEIAPFKCNPSETGYYIQAQKLPESIADMVADSAKNLQYYLDFDMTETSDGENEKTITMFFDVNVNEAEEDSDSEVVPTTTTLKPTRPPQTEPNTTTEAMATTLTTQSLTTATYATTLTTNAATTLTTQSPTTATYATTLTTNAVTTLTTAPMTATATAIVSTGAVGECSTNADCQNNDYYCDTIMTSSCSNGKNTREDEGVCKPVGSSSSKTVGTVTYYKGVENTDWWSSVRYCEALKTQGKVTNGTLVSLSELGCTSSGCTAGGLWSKLGWSGYAWTSTPYNNDNNSCYAYVVSLFDGNIYNGIRERALVGRDGDGSTSYGYALCE